MKKPDCYQCKWRGEVIFWIDRKYPWRIWFGKTYHKGKYNWIDLRPGKETLKIERRFKDGRV